MDNKQKIIVVISVVALVAFCALIFYMSAQPADDSDEMSLGVVDMLARMLIPGFDSMSLDQQQEMLSELNHPVRKLAHFTEFAVLGALTYNLVFQIGRARSAGGAQGARSAGDAEGARGARSAGDAEGARSSGEAKDARGARNSADAESAQNAGSERSTQRAGSAGSAKCARQAPGVIHKPNALRDGRRWRKVALHAVIAWAAATLYAVTDEIHQIFVPGRACMITDVCIDSAGVLTGVIVAVGLWVAASNLSRQETVKSRRFR